MLHGANYGDWVGRDSEFAEKGKVALTRAQVTTGLRAYKASP